MHWGQIVTSLVFLQKFSPFPHYHHPGFLYFRWAPYHPSKCGRRPIPGWDHPSCLEGHNTLHLHKTIPTQLGGGGWSFTVFATKPHSLRPHISTHHSKVKCFLNPLKTFWASNLRPPKKTNTANVKCFDESPTCLRFGDKWIFLRQTWDSFSRWTGFLRLPNLGYPSTSCQKALRHIWSSLWASEETFFPPGVNECRCLCFKCGPSGKVQVSHKWPFASDHHLACGSPLCSLSLSLLSAWVDPIHNLDLRSLLISDAASFL